MKRTILLLLCLLFILTACKQSHITGNDSPDEIMQAENLPEEYQQILLNQKAFLLYGQQMLIDAYKSPYLQKELAHCDTVEYAVVDMDGDKKPELLIRGWSQDILVLHEENGVVYGYDFTFQAMYNLNQDGHYYWNANAGTTYGCSRLSFINGECKQIELYRVEHAENDEAKFFVDNVEASKSAFDTYCKQLTAAKAIVWYTLDGYPKK